MVLLLLSVFPGRRTKDLDSIEIFNTNDPRGVRAITAARPFAAISDIYSVVHFAKGKTTLFEKSKVSKHMESANDQYKTSLSKRLLEIYDHLHLTRCRIVQRSFRTSIS